MTNEIVMSKGVRLKKNVLVYLAIIVGVVVLFTAKSVIGRGSDAVPETRRDFSGRSKLVAANRRILANPTHPSADQGGDLLWRKRQKNTGNMNENLGLGQRGVQEPSNQPKSDSVWGSNDSGLQRRRDSMMSAKQNKESLAAPGNGGFLRSSKTTTIPHSLKQAGQTNKPSARFGGWGKVGGAEKDGSNKQVGFGDQRNAGREQGSLRSGEDPFQGMQFYDGSGNLVVSQPNWIVVTSIQAPTTDVKALSQVPGWKLIVVADTKTPKDWKCPNVVFLSVEMQEKLKLNVLKLIPYKSYARKNIGYFFAIRYGAKLIYDTDDDNQPNDGFRSFNLEDGVTSTVLYVKNPNSTYNPYPHFGQQTIWPRGYPIEEVSNDVPRDYQLCETNTPLLRQGIVNGDPDVDAIYRLFRKHTTKRLNLQFDGRAPRVVVPPNTLAPYNSQNTISSYDVFWGLAFPVTLNFRVCDIWRSYWAQRLMWLIGKQAGFYTAGTFQFRSAHSYLKDFKDEQQLYYQAGDYVRFLIQWRCQSQDFVECIKMMSHDMADKGFWNKTDAKFIDAWLADLKAVGYKPPTVNPISKQKCLQPPTNVIYYPQEQPATYGEVREYLLPPFVKSKYDALGNIVKANCPRLQTPIRDLTLNGSSLINDILLVIHLEGTPTSDLISRLELFYRPRFGQILYCGKWQEQAKSILHKWRVSFAEIPESAADPQMACLYKAADIHYIVDGYLVINQHALLNHAQMNKPRKSVWMQENWASTPGTNGGCQGASCSNAQIDLDKVVDKLGKTGSTKPVNSCSLYKPGTSFSYNKDRVFYVPDSYNKQLRIASKTSLDGVSMAAWIQCTGTNIISLRAAAELKAATQLTDYVQKYDFTDMNNLCPILGYNP